MYSDDRQARDSGAYAIHGHGHSGGRTGVLAPTGRGAVGQGQGRVRGGLVPGAIPGAVRPTGPSGHAAIDLEALLADAVRAPGGCSVRFLPELERLVESLNSQARLTTGGAAAVVERLRTALTRPVQLRMLRSAVPAIAHIEPAPVFITGLPGSGAGLLHNLLAEHPAVDAPTLWELAEPVARAAGPREFRALIGRGRAAAEAGSQALHGRPAGLLRTATRPGGCSWLLGNAFQSVAFALPWRVPGYADGLAAGSMTEAYHFHREQLQAICHRIPGPAPLLRDPFHAGHLGDLFDVYPSARVIVVHHDPVRTVTATAGISHALRGAGSDGGDPRETGREWTGRIERQLVAAEVARRSLPGGRILDVRHADLVGAPTDEVRRVLAFMGVEQVPVVEGNVAELAARTMRAANRSVPFRPAEFGISRGALAGRFAFYRERYGL
ncbi:sulfotransferase [Streptomyces sp. ISL-98]|uniref:sulfotransferase family protein n=1 Tax=Streptomyces sp. ISL-98 TaxID=2819192 RepID=UPI001BE5CFC6|nr:sulfotransferase [Streptomyces sp. ISL-98]MBT2507208.1 sulfotransferase [Streptomyces sp. ISL-98]